jgi:hypothetical protein
LDICFFKKKYVLGHFNHPHTAMNSTKQGNTGNTAMLAPTHTTQLEQRIVSKQKNDFKLQNHLNQGMGDTANISMRTKTPQFQQHPT